MAGTYGRSAVDLKNELLKRGPAFSFFQVVRLLRTLLEKPQKDTTVPGLPVSRLKIRPNLSLAFPAAGIAGIHESGPDRYTVSANLLGLYGSGSPLPTFYIEELIEDEGNGDETVRDLIDVANHRLYELLFHFLVVPPGLFYRVRGDECRLQFQPEECPIDGFPSVINVGSKQCLVLPFLIML